MILLEHHSDTNIILSKKKSYLFPKWLYLLNAKINRFISYFLPLNIRYSTSIYIYTNCWKLSWIIKLLYPNERVHVPRDICSILQSKKLVEIHNL
jgi:hypothetical protein